MDEAGLASALEELATTTGRLHEIQCTFEPEGEVLIYQREMATHLYRIAQEATSNAVRHGHATVVTIRLAIAENQVTLTIRDNGRGIPAPELPSTGMGLRSMRYRAGALHGSIDISALPTGGTKVCCRAPLPANPISNSIHAS
jgi:two-component system CheB/CheR fusion protein